VTREAVGSTAVGALPQTPGFFEAWLRCSILKEKASDGFRCQRHGIGSTHRRSGYPLSGCVPAEPDSVLPDSKECNTDYEKEALIQ
jgi:hypothetical protein